jgi:type VI secretion system protein ImpK
MNDPNNPFGGGGSDDEHTVIRPNPGRRAAIQAAQARGGVSAGPVIDVTELSGLNPLESAASLILNILGQIRNTSSHPNPDALHQQLSGEVKKFETRAQKSGIAPETVFTARYVLCSTVDEFVLGTPWGANSIWNKQSLLRVFHRETIGGEKVFLLLDKLIQDPARNLDLLELIYVCLALGFQGRYRVETNGAATLEAIRENLYRTIRNQRGDSEAGLSPHWEGLDKALVSKGARFPAWAMAAIAFAVLGFVYGAFYLGLLRHNEMLYDPDLRIISRADNLAARQMLLPAPLQRIAAPTKERFSLKIFMADEIAAGQVSVDENPDAIIVRLHGDVMFDSGQDVIKSSYEPILEKLSEGLIETSGSIQVIGHSDSDRISTRRFPSNRALSQARADEVVKILSTRVPSNRMTSIGMADKEPIASNDTAAGKARNRRVEVTVNERAGGS